MKKKLSLFTLFLVMPFVIFGAIQIWWFSQAPHATSVNDTDIMLVERPVPHTNLWFNMAQLRSYTSTGLTNLTVSNAYITNIYVITGAVDNITVTNGITNLSLTPNTVLQADANKRITSIPNGTGALTNDGAGNFGWTAVVGSSGPWTNNSDFIWPAGEPAPDTTGATPGPGFFFRYDGSKFVGTNVTADVVVTTANTVYDYTVSMLASNDPPSAKFFNYGINNENYDYFAGFTLFRFVDANNPLSTFQLEAQTTGGTWHSFKATSDPGGSTTGLLLQTNNPGSIFKVDNDGLTTANGYVDSSGNVGDLVAYGTLGRLVSTNVTAIISGLTNIQQNFATTNNSSTLTNIISSIASNAVPVQTNFNLLAVTNLFAGTIVATNGYFTNLTVGTLYSATNFFGQVTVTNNIDFLTNLSTMAPDFSKGYAAITTNASFSFLSPINVDPTKTKVQTAVVRVDNSSGSALVVTPPAGVIVISNSFMGVGANGTTWFTFVSYPPDRTNVYANAETH